MSTISVVLRPIVIERPDIFAAGLLEAYAKLTIDALPPGVVALHLSKNEGENTFSLTIATKLGKGRKRTTIGVVRKGGNRDYAVLELITQKQLDRQVSMACEKALKKLADLGGLTNWTASVKPTPYQL